MKKILVTGCNGQLGHCIRELSGGIKELDFIFKSSSELDITSEIKMQEIFISENFDYCINCAAYTKVDLAENEQDKAFEINAEGVRILSEYCKKGKTILIHISTDFVFDGTKTSPYTENDIPKPINTYGKSKLKGELYINQILQEYFIIRTSWLYSEYGHNFLRTMLRISENKTEIDVVSDQFGTPTYAKDLAEIILSKIIIEENKKFGIYHFSNDGIASWYDFAKTIFEFSNKKISVNAIDSIAYPTSATRPLYSVLDKSKIKGCLHLNPLNWKNSLKRAILNSTFKLNT
ncbi:dTDP-4-dehydrorhamnose reductase [Maribacter sp. X9]|uniref:dTDP-4-dehydrorhamnose reductase n=1 Tax=Maribacter sp. X9 TaxID=3402159 RepID=UPI003AF3A8E7